MGGEVVDDVELSTANPPFLLQDNNNHISLRILTILTTKRICFTSFYHYQHNIPASVISMAC